MYLEVRFRSPLSFLSVFAGFSAPRTFPDKSFSGKTFRHSRWVRRPLSTYLVCLRGSFVQAGWPGTFDPGVSGRHRLVFGSLVLPPVAASAVCLLPRLRPTLCVVSWPGMFDPGLSLGCRLTLRLVAVLAAGLPWGVRLRFRVWLGGPLASAALGGIRRLLRPRRAFLD